MGDKVATLSSIAAASCLLFGGFSSLPAWGQIEFAKCTIRVTSPVQPSQVASRQANQQQPNQQQATEQRDGQPRAGQPFAQRVARREFVAEEVPSAEREGGMAQATGPVRQANFEEPMGASSAAEAARPEATLQQASSAGSPPQARPRAVVAVYTSPSAQATLGKIPRPASVQPAAATQPLTKSLPSRGKPFQTIVTDPEVSPYLNLYRTDLNPSMMPNYYALVRPQFEQLQANRKQAAEMQRMRAQLRNMAEPPSAQPTHGYGGTVSGHKTSAKYMDTGQFYQRPRR